MFTKKARGEGWETACYERPNDMPVKSETRHTPSAATAVQVIAEAKAARKAENAAPKKAPTPILAARSHRASVVQPRQATETNE